MTLYTWSTTAASNDNADSSINWAEGMAPSAVNDSARAEMAAVAKARDDWAGSLTTAGTSTAYTLTSNQGFDTLAHLGGNKLKVRFDQANGSAPTLNVDSLGAKDLQVASGVAVPSGFIVADSVWDVTYDNSIPAFLLSGVAASPIISDSSITYAKLQDETTNTLLGNVSGAGAAPDEITIGTGLVVSASTLTAPGFPPAAAFKNLVIKVASNTTVTVSADFVTTTDGTNFQTTAVSSTINMATTGADALDTGTTAIDTWYAIWVIAKADGTTKCLASSSFTSPTLPSGYTYKARVGAVRTIHASANLYGTWQFGRKAQYVNGLAETSALPTIESGAKGTFSSTAPTWSTPSISNFVPSTASEIALVINNNFNNGTVSSILVAPSDSYAGQESTNPPIYSSSVLQNASATVNLALEGTTVAWVSSLAGGCLQCLGWTDNI